MIVVYFNEIENKIINTNCSQADSTLLASFAFASYRVFFFPVLWAYASCKSSYWSSVFSIGNTDPSFVFTPLTFGNPSWYHPKPPRSRKSSCCGLSPGISCNVSLPVSYEPRRVPPLRKLVQHLLQTCPPLQLYPSATLATTYPSQLQAIAILDIIPLQAPWLCPCLPRFQSCENDYVWCCTCNTLNYKIINGIRFVWIYKHEITGMSGPGDVLLTPRRCRCSELGICIGRSFRVLTMRIGWRNPCGRSAFCMQRTSWCPC